MEVEEGGGRGGVQEVGGEAAVERAEVVGVRGGSGGGGGVWEGGGGEGAGGGGEEEDCLTAMMSPSGGFCKLWERERREKKRGGERGKERGREAWREEELNIQLVRYTPPPCAPSVSLTWGSSPACSSPPVQTGLPGSLAPPSSAVFCE